MLPPKHPTPAALHPILRPGNRFGDIIRAAAQAREDALTLRDQSAIARAREILEQAAYLGVAR